MLHLEYNPINFIINYTIVEIFPSCVPVSKVDALEFIICCVKRILWGEEEKQKEEKGERYTERKETERDIGRRVYTVKAELLKKQWRGRSRVPLSRYFHHPCFYI